MSNIGKAVYTMVAVIVIFLFMFCLKQIDVDSKEIENESELMTETESEYPSCFYTTEDYEILAHVINGEAESNSYELKLGVGSVVLNRVKDPRFPNTIKEVVFQSGQYACTWDGNYDKTPVEDSYKAALELLECGSVYPPEVVWQANHCQGEIYEYYENTYFCS